MMRTVLLSLLPIVVFSTYLYGLRVLLLLSIVIIMGTITEYLWEKRRSKKVSEAVLVTSILYTMTLPVSTPFWVASLGIIFGLFFGKLVFGGFGRNVFNVALVGRAFIYVNFPEPLTISWNKVASGIQGGFGTYITNGIDVVSEATPMILFNNTGELTDIYSLITGIVPGSIGETSMVLIVLGAIYLVYKKVASWQIMISSILGFLVTSTVLYYFTDVTIANPIYGMLLGGFLFGTVFMATDPISGARTKKGKWIYGSLIGIVTVLIRGLSLFHGGVMFAILIANIFVPIIDYFVNEASKAKKKNMEVTS
ncbi:RnfABCDGE type electron transport complex subunit D [Alkalibaculum sp. M08DMB]|uniref:RnfABCDGE type electron transport complex subunit D n=2 Tax=Alkalibaculum sporogenes TaxID=2655001 RepID=A0A6A7K8W9_9FIRM|nr:RnfABCDGE type electron transport complex subunit D [Alkalibaculum sporogenes]